MTKTLILPGLNGSGATHWQRLWAEDCPGSDVVEQTDWQCPNLNTWRSTLERRLAETDDTVFLVAHSLGCWLASDMATSPQAGKIKSAFLVAPCDLQVVEKLHPCAVQVPPKPLARLPFPSLVVGSENDHYMMPSRLLDHAEIWGSDVALLGHVGHINVDSGFGRWRNGYQLFRDFNSRLADEACEERPRQGSRKIDLLDKVINSGLSAIPY